MDDPAQSLTDTATALDRDREKRRLQSQLHVEKHRYEAALRKIAELEARQEFLDSTRDPTPRAPKKSAARRGKNRHGTTAVLVLTDWHIEERVERASVNNLNHYDPEEASRRINAVMQRSLELIEAWRRTWPVTEIVVGLLGDMITGYIHEELLEDNWLSPTEACLLAQDHIAGLLPFLAKETKLPVRVVTCNGNHGRTTPRRRVSTGWKNSYEWLMYNQLARLTPQFQWQISRGYHNWVEVQGHELRLHHGDGIRYQGGVGGIMIPVNKAVAAWNKSKRPLCDIFGHWHQFVHTRDVVSCNCLIGYNAYSIEIKAEWAPPSQTLVLISREHGKVGALEVFV